MTMRVLVVWQDEAGNCDFMPIECSYAEVQKLRAWHGKFINHVDNTDAEDNDMTAFFYKPDTHGNLSEYRFDRFPGPLCGYFNLVVHTGLM